MQGMCGKGEVKDTDLCIVCKLCVGKEKLETLKDLCIVCKLCVGKEKLKILKDLCIVCKLCVGKE